MSHSKITRCGYVAIVGRPNVGKSTLLNKILGQKISITSRKPQTTRQRILGIKTTDTTQTVYVDTPGLHQQAKRKLNRYMNRAATQSFYDVSAIVFVVEALQWREDDEWILAQLMKLSEPIILVVNKIDQVKDKEELLPYLQLISAKFNFAQVIPLSATKGTNISALEQAVDGYLSAGPFLFAEDQVTDRSERFLAAEIVREKLFRNMQQEVPYGLTVGIEKFVREEKILRISAVIWVEKEGQKAIIIGAQGGALKLVGTNARKELEKLFDIKVFLQLWVKVKENWADDERALRSLGYSDE